MTRDEMHHPVVDVDDIDFASAVIEQSYIHPVVVDFWAPWCGPCRTLGPTLERLATAGNGAWTLAKINVDNNQQLAQRYQVQGIPAVKAFVDGKQVAEFTGAIPESQIVRWLEGFVPVAIDDLLTSLIALGSTDIHAALQGFAALISTQPHNDAARIAYAKLLILRKDSEAIPVLQGISPQGAFAEQASGWRSIAAAAQETYSEDDPNAPAYTTALHAFLQNDVATGLTGMLELIVRARAWNDDAARKTYLAMLQTLHHTDPILAQGRRDLASALF
ncbi:MAG: hypothetical protein RLY87_2215 [Chloroflexota bacterium]